MQRMPAVLWLAKCGVGAVILLFVCRIATAWFGSGLQLPATTTRDGTQVTRRLGSAIWRLLEVPQSPVWRSLQINRAFPGSFWLK